MRIQSQIELIKSIYKPHHRFTNAWSARLVDNGMTWRGWRGGSENKRKQNKQGWSFTIANQSEIMDEWAGEYMYRGDLDNKVDEADMIQ